MKFVKSEALEKYINELAEINDINNSLGELFQAIINNEDIEDIEEIKALAKRYSDKEENVYLSLIMDYLDIDFMDDDNYNFYINHIKPCFKELDVKEYKANPYYQNIKIKDIKNGDYALLNDKYRPYEVFSYDDIYFDENLERSRIGYFNEEFVFPALNYKNVTWMNITPNEINTMKLHLDKVKGNIIVFGLGLGYFPYMASIKEEVTSITIIEKDEKIISLFNKYIYPNFVNKNKIKIVKADALDIIAKKLNYDYAFIDLWHSQEDGLPLYLKFKKSEDMSSNCTFLYWLDTSFYALFKRAFISLIYEQYHQIEGLNYNKENNTLDHVVNLLYKSTKNLLINNVEEIKDLLNKDKLINLLI